MTNSTSIKLLNIALANELGAIWRYFVNSKLLKDLGLYKISKKLKESIEDEMGHVDMLVDRIVFLGGMPELNVSNDVSKINDVKEVFLGDLKIENDGAEFLTSSISELEKNKDYVSAKVLRDILESEIEHISWITEQLNLIQMIGLISYLNENG